MYKKRFSKNMIITAAAAAVFVIAAVSSALLGINIYESSSSMKSQDRINDAYGLILDEIRRCGDKDNIRTASIDGKVPALVILKGHKGQREEWIFSDGSSLRKVDVKKGSAVTAMEGEGIMALSSMDAEMAGDDMVRLNLSHGDESSSFNIDLAGFGGGDD